jgi:hypothetical protein
LLDEVLEVLHQGARRLFWRDVSREGGVEPILHLEGHVRVVGRDWARPRVLEGLPGEGNDGDALLYLGLAVQSRPRRQIRAIDGPELLLLGRGKELYELLERLS